MKRKKFDIIVIILILMLAISIPAKTFQNDTFYIIKVGESIVNNGIDMLDHFSIHNIMYPYEHWLHDLIIFFIYSKTGFVGLYISNMVFTFILGLILYFCSKKLYKNKYVSLIITISVIILLQPFIATRAQLVSYILFALEIFFLEMITSTGKWKYGIFLIIDSVFLVNVHATTWPMYLFLFIPYFISCLLSNYKNKKICTKELNSYKKSVSMLFDKLFLFTDNKIKIDKFKFIKKLIIVFLLCILTGFINPNCNQSFTHFVKLKLGITLSFISEHQPIVLYNNVLFLIYLSIIIMYLIFSRAKISIKDFIILSGLLFLTLSSYRHMALFLVIGSFSVVNLFSSIKISKKANKKKIVLLISFIILYLSIFNFVNNISKNYVSDIYPIEAAQFINENCDKSKMRLYNDYDYGSYLMYKDIPVFIDSRANLYTKQFNHLDRDIANDWYTIYKTGHYKKIFKIYNITNALVPKDSIIDKSLRLENDYEIIYQDKKFVLFQIKD